MIKCENINCKHHKDNNTCELKKAVIGCDGKCQNFEKGFVYYFYYFDNMTSNMILTFDLNDDMKYSIYYLTKCLPIEFAIDYIRGYVVLREIGGDKYLNKNDIYEMISSDKLNDKALRECIEDFEKNGLPNPNKDKKEETKPKIDYQPYGWLSPNGDFIEGEWGTHEEAAEEIINNHDWHDEYWSWHKHDSTCKLALCRDFLSEIKGYALIHNPSNLGYIVTNTKPLTKKQKDFLYGYFIDMGDRLRAEKYLED